jgi:phosphatidylserine/phosphatidylglycerophosphate/cardiolipin synthase-like enzyme
VSSENLGLELVITAPEPYGAALGYRTRTRNTIGALTQMIAKAQEHVVLSAPYLQSGYGLSAGPLFSALTSALRRGVDVDIASTAQSLETLNPNQLAQGAKGALRLYRHFANVEDERNIGSHAKFCVIDSRWAYIGSANLTGPGLSKHLELGILVEGDIARQLAEFWLYSVEIGMFIIAS